MIEPSGALDVENSDVSQANVADTSVPNVKQIENDTWEARNKRIQEARQTIQPGFQVAAPRFATDADPMALSVSETIDATLRQGLTASIFGGFKFDPNSPIDPDYDVSQDMRPQDAPYTALFARSPNTMETHRLQADIDRRNNDLRAMQARPGVSFAAAFLDPATLGIDLATYGTGALVTLPLLANGLRRTTLGLRAVEALQKTPKAAAGLKEAAVGGQAGALSMYAQQKIKTGTNDLETEENIGTNVFFGAVIGSFLGGSVGLLGKKRSQEIVDEFTKGNNVTQHAAAPPPDDFVGPPKPSDADLGILSTGKRPDIRAQAPKEEPVQRTPEQAKSEYETLKYEANEGGLPARASAYANLRARFAVIGESIISNKNVPLPIRVATSLVRKAVRNMSAANRALSRPFGTARLYTMGMVRNAVEFTGTREGLILPRAAQNRIEDIANQALDMSVDLNLMYLEANNIKPGLFSAERMKFSQRVYEEEAFYRDVSEHLLHVGKPSEAGRAANPLVRKAAKHVYDKFYRPFGELLQEYKLIPDQGDVVKELNYLNRQWKTSELLGNPEEFKKWLADFYKEQNDKLKSLLPAYDSALSDARTLANHGRRFERAAKKIEALKNKIGEEQYAGKINQINQEKEEAANGIVEKYADKRDVVSAKYEKLRAAPKPAAPNLSESKKALKKEIADATKEREELIKQYDKEKAKLDAELKNIRHELKVKKQAIKDGKYDDYIKKEVIAADIKAMQESFGGQQYHTPAIEDIARETAENLDPQTLTNLRKDFIGFERLNFIERIDEVKIKRVNLKQERKEILALQREELKTKVREATALLEQESKAAGKQSTENKAKAAIDKAEKLELKTIEVKEANELVRNEEKAIRQIHKLQEPIARLELLQQKYSRAGYTAFAQRRGIERMAKRMSELGTDEKTIEKLLSDARKAERKQIEAAPIVDEAQQIADELAEGATIELKRAEEIIPDDLRSNTTGRPYRTFDEATEPRYAYEQAERTFYTMIGQEDEMVVNPILTQLGGGQSSVFKPRSLKMPDNYPGIERWVERDIRILMNNFSSGISPAIALTELMHEFNKLPIVRQTVKRMQVNDPSIGIERALDMPDTMQHYMEIPKVFATMMREEFRILSEGLKGKELEKLLREYQGAEKDLVTIDKQIKGIFGNGVNVNAKTASDIVDLGNSLASTVTTNNIVISMLSDGATSAIRYGFGDYITKSLRPLLTDPVLRNLTKDELKVMHLGLKTAVGTIVKSRMVGKTDSLKNSVIGRGIMNAANRIGNITGANKMQDLLEMASVCLIKTELLDYAEKAALGTLTEKEITHLAQRSTSVEQVKNIYDLYKRYGFKRGPSKGIDVSTLGELSPKDSKAFSDYQAFINDDLRTYMVKPGAGSLPDFSYSPAGKSVLFLKKYFFAATNDLLLPALQRADKEAAQGFMGLFAIGALQSEIRHLYRGEERKPFNLEGFIAEALTNSGLLGIGTFGVDAGLAAGIIAGMGGARYDPSNGLPSLLLGPGIVGYSDRTLNILGKMRKIMTDEDKQFTYKDWNYLANTAIPLYKWAPISAVVKPNLREYFESIGRGE